jgi:Fe-S cluster assembly scaffold protein SufB
MAIQARELTKDYQFGFHDEDISVFRTKKGLSPEVVAAISQHKNEPEWMLKLRLKALDHFMKRPMPTWGADLSGIDFDNIYYYVKPVEEMSRSWDDVPDSIKRTFDRLGIPQAERKFLAGVSAQYDSEVVYHSIRADLEKLGVLFSDCDTGLREHEDIFRKYFGTVIPANDNKFAALNSAVWSGGSFVYVPKGVHVDVPLQAYFRINSDNMGQFERTLIIAEEGSSVHYIEGCTAPNYSSDSLHSAVVELIAHPGAKIRYTTIQNWSDNVYNLVTKRAIAHENATVEWIDGNLGCIAGGAEIWTSAGPKVIEEVRAGDVVRSYSEDGGWLDQQVVATKINAPRATWRVTLSDGRSVVATDNHPFRAIQDLPELGRTPGGGPHGHDLGWLALKDLRPGMSLASTYHPSPAMAREPALVGASHDAPPSWRGPETSVNWLTVTSIDVEGEQETYDLEVEGTANFVANGIVVHNSKVTMKYPSVYLMGEHAHAEVMSAAFAGSGQHQDAGSKAIHVAPNTSSNIVSRSISKGSGRTSYRGHIKVLPKASNVKVNVRCDALLLDEESRSDTYPYMDIDNPDVTVGHEASVSKIGEDQLFYLTSRGITEQDATALIINGFFEPFVKELPMEYAVELNRLLALSMEGAIG